ncbi:MAG TPA: DUF4476 domain-containing protein, partial [Bacteroidia bacterium]|nr:DUF4476 domain-containing protein [Bacteroidia bacterium]
MKKIFVLIFALHAICYAQTPCSQPIEGTEFNKHFDVLNRIQNDQDRLATAKDLFRNKCLSAKQLKIVCMIFNNERPRLNFALYAFDRVADKDEFYEVLDAFKLYSSAFK